MQTDPRLAWLRLVFPALAALALLLAPSGAEAFATQLPLRETPRWNAEPYRGTGLHDGIQVGVEPGLANAFGLEPAEVTLLEQAILAAFAAWESPVLRFDVNLDAPVVRGTQPGEGFEIDVLALPGDDPLFAGSEFFGRASSSADFVAGRLLTNGQRTDGLVIVGGDIYLNVDNILAFRDVFALTPEQRAAAFQRLLMHEIGHLLALGHPNDLVGDGIDSDDDPLSPVVVDPCDVEAGLRFSFFFDRDAVMSNAPTLAGILVTAPRPDDAAGRDVLYPVAPPGVACGPFPPGGFEVPGSVVLDSGGGGAGFDQPTDLLVDALGRLLMAHGSGVIRVNAEGSEESLLSDDTVALLGRVLRIAYGPRGALYATGLMDNVVRVEPDGTATEILDASGDGVNTFDFGDSIAVDPLGNVFVASRNTNTVFRVDPLGGVEQVVVGSPQAPLSAPGDVATDSAGTLYVAGVLSNNVLKRTPDGAVRQVLGVAGTGDGVPFARPVALAVDAADRVYALSNRGIVYRIHPDESVEVFRSPQGVWDPPLSPVGLALDALGNAYVADTRRDQGLQFPADAGWVSLFDVDPGGLEPDPVILQLAANALGSLYVSWRIGGRFQVFRVDPPCRAEDSVPEIRRALPRRPLAGSFGFLSGVNFEPGARAFLDQRLLETEPVSSRLLFARLPVDAGGHAELRVVNPATCASEPEPVHVVPLPARCGQLGGELALLPPLWWLGRRGARRRQDGSAPGGG